MVWAFNESARKFLRKMRNDPAVFRDGHEAGRRNNMKKEETFQILEEYLKGIPVYNTHSHHLPAEQLTDVGLDYLLAHST